jgi:hypothetical protein
MPLSICTACGTQYPESAQTPTRCVICEEERQYVPPHGQTWTTLEALRQSHTNTFREYENGIIGIGATPAFAIGQRALLVCTDQGNILWDCIATLDDATVTMIEGLGGIDAIAISHPHFYTTMVEWAHARYLHDTGKSLFVWDCVVGLGGLELPTKRLSVASSEQPVRIDFARFCFSHDPSVVARVASRPAAQEWPGLIGVHPTSSGAR